MNIMYKPYVESLYTFGTMEKLLNKNKMNKNNRKFKTLYYKKKKNRFIQQNYNLVLNETNIQLSKHVFKLLPRRELRSCTRCN